MNWISVKDKLPEKEDIYLVYINKSKEFERGPSIWFSYFDNYRWNKLDLEFPLDLKNITHWMKVPKKPE